MSILNSASNRTVYRGYDYYKEGNVISHIQLSDFEYEGEVQGTKKRHIMYPSIQSIQKVHCAIVLLLMAILYANIW